ncbi:phosphodiester glycosidase family protein [Erythrobacter sp. R86502]|uniref:phosphodiester glycosidase family protein n=1 Tax=Erythrobacter sp. R86502 TaxID=3093846 RepID=UPI0036D25A1E
MKYRVFFAAFAMVALTNCSDAPSGDAVVTVNLDGSPNSDAPSQATAKMPMSGPSACRSVNFEQVPLTHCVADPNDHHIGMVNLAADKKPFGSMKAFADNVDPDAIAFAVNGGMYGDDLKPIGYYVENGNRFSELDRNGGEGNFYMKPNGVFFGTGSKWRVLGSNTFFKTIGDRPEFGTQSGPLLLIDGKLHPNIQNDGPSKAIRNGVGVDSAGKAHFVISEAPVSFGQLARYFHDEVKVSTALYLDGQISSLWDPANQRLDNKRIGPIIVVTKRKKAASE